MRPRVPIAAVTDASLFLEQSYSGLLMSVCMLNQAGLRLQVA